MPEPSAAVSRHAAGRDSAASRAAALRQSLRALAAPPPVASALTRSDAATAIGVAEAELVAAHAGCFDDRNGSPLAARRLRPRRPQLAAALAGFGSAARVITGHRACRIERVGPAPVPLRWAQVYALEQRDACGRLVRSVQLFDSAGDSLAEVVPGDDRGVAAWLDLVEGCASFDAATRLQRPRRPAPPRALPKVADAAAWHRAWNALRGPAALDALLAAHAMTPAAAFRQAPPSFARRVSQTSAHALLAAAAQQGVPVTVEVRGAPACRGEWRCVRLAGDWLQADAAGEGLQRLHLREDAVAEAWLLGCPSARGLRQALWLLDADGAAVARLSDAASHAAACCGWRQLVALLDAEE